MIVKQKLVFLSLISKSILSVIMILKLLVVMNWITLFLMLVLTLLTPNLIMVTAELVFTPIFNIDPMVITNLMKMINTLTYLTQVISILFQVVIKVIRELKFLLLMSIPLLTTKLLVQMAAKLFKKSTSEFWLVSLESLLDPTDGLPMSIPTETKFKLSTLMSIFKELKVANQDKNVLSLLIWMLPVINMNPIGLILILVTNTLLMTGCTWESGSRMPPIPNNFHSKNYITRMIKVKSLTILLLLLLLQLDGIVVTKHYTFNSNWLNLLQMLLFKSICWLKPPMLVSEDCNRQLLLLLHSNSLLLYSLLYQLLLLIKPKVLLIPLWCSLDYLIWSLWYSSIEIK